MAQKKEPIEECNSGINSQGDAQSEKLRQYELILIIIEILSFFLAGLLSQHFLIAISIFIITIAVTIIILSPRGKGEHIRHKIVHTFSHLFWQKFLQLNQAIAELMFWRYVNKEDVKKYSSLSPRDSYVQYKNIKIKVKIDTKSTHLHLRGTDLIIKDFIPKQAFLWNNIIYRLERLKMGINNVTLLYDQKIKFTSSCLPVDLLEFLNIQVHIMLFLQVHFNLAIKVISMTH